MKAAFAGIDLNVKDSKTKLEEAEAKLSDPLSAFPNDVDYLDEKHCNIKIRLTTDPKLALPYNQQWNDYRKDCCLGKYVQEAKRCSMNDTLWGRYLNAIEAGRPLTLDAIKNMVEFDMVRRELYPKDFKGDPNENPTPEYINKLKQSGKYTEILQKLNVISKRIQKSGS